MEFLSCGVGVQSSTLARMFAIGYGDLPKLDAALFSDTEEEPAEVYKHAARLENEIRHSLRPYPFYTLRGKQSLSKAALTVAVSKKTNSTYMRLLIPAYIAKADGSKALMGRKCTSEFKVRRLVAKARQLCKPPRRPDGKIYARTAIGISYDEVERMKPSQEWWCENWWPLIDMKMTRQDCIQWNLDHGFSIPPRSACTFCPFHSDAEWGRIKRESPVEFEKVVRFEKLLQEGASLTNGKGKLRGVPFLHSSLKPIGEVVLKDLESHAQVSQFGNECEGLCGV